MEEMDCSGESRAPGLSPALAPTKELPAACLPPACPSAPPQGVVDVPIYGRISVLRLYRPPGEEKDLLFLLTERYKFAVLQYDEDSGEAVQGGEGRGAGGRAAGAARAAGRRWWRGLPAVVLHRLAEGTGVGALPHVWAPTPPPPPSRRRAADAGARGRVGQGWAALGRGSDRCD